MEENMVSYRASEVKTKPLFMSSVFLVISGVFFLTLMAQISIQLSWSPVPITGQTLGVSLISLLFGSKRAVATLLTYIAVGALGLPVFALGRSGFVFGPTSGYLLGMLLSSFVLGSIKDRNWCNTGLRIWLSAYLGSAIIFISGLSILRFFVPFNQLLNLGFFPYLPGDFIKNTLATLIILGLLKIREKSKTTTSI